MYPAATLLRTEVRTIDPALNGVTYRLAVWLPEEYAHTAERYPVLYLLDPHVGFGTATEVATLLHKGPEARPFVIVGIGYELGDLASLRTARTRDYTPTVRAEFGPSGGAAAFLEVLTSEILPLIETSYRVDPHDRSLFGYSLSGLFGLYVLFQQPGLFRSYGIGSPSLWWDERWIFGHEAAFAARQHELAVRLCLSVNALEDEAQWQMRSNVAALGAILRQRQYANLMLHEFVLADETHLSGAAGTLAKHIKWLFGLGEGLNRQERQEREEFK